MQQTTELINMNLKAAWNETRIDNYCFLNIIIQSGNIKFG